MRPPVELFLVDAFTRTIYRGNPAAVCIAPEGGEPGLFTGEWMQSVAMEMNLSETAFLIRLPQKGAGSGSEYDLRWFTPTTEVELCGHATLASAHILWERGYADSGKEICFYTKSAGKLIAGRNKGLIELDFPADTVTVVTPPDAIAQALGVEPVFAGK
ncbi:Phenazine biosynthesis protein PhzF like, partial [hydrothermal vent metagenome]